MIAILPLERGITVNTKEGNAWMYDPYTQRLVDTFINQQIEETPDQPGITLLSPTSTVADLTLLRAITSHPEDNRSGFVILTSRRKSDFL